MDYQLPEIGVHGKLPFSEILLSASDITIASETRMYIFLRKETVRLVHAVSAAATAAVAAAAIVCPPRSAAVGIPSLQLQ